MARVHTRLVVLLAALLTCAQSSNIDVLIAKADIYYYQPTAGEGEELTLREIDALSAKENLKVVVHGFTGSRTHASIQPLVAAYRAAAYGNVYVADWEDAAGLDYHTSRYAIGKVARHFAALLNAFLDKFQIERSEVHVIGHSLGAHIAGGIGAHFNGSLGRVTGLDPALPLFAPHSSDGLHATAAQFVDVIHTDYPFFGDLTPRGTADFYPHYGRAPQRGCDEISLAAAGRLVFEAYSCSHNRAVSLYAETVAEPLRYPAMPCAWNGILLRNITACSASPFAATAATALVYMGENVTRDASGFFYVN